MKPKDLKRFWKKVEKTELCWLWTAGLQKDYGAFHMNGRMRPAHRVIYEHIYGEIEKGLEIDHVCFTKNCVNPMHLEAVTPSVNTRRGIKNAGLVSQLYKSRKVEYCSNGHKRTMGNTYINGKTKVCRVCQLASVKRYQKSRVAS